jgi:6,7-dimethyl-8-ribityllumazine synthase
MELTITRHLAIGNGILTVENSDQAWVRADMDKKDKGGDAARAALEMASLKHQMLAGNKGSNS